MAPKTMKGIKIVSQGKAEIQDVPVPELRDGCLMVKVKCVALNPLDFMIRDFLPIPGASMGGDFSGTVDDVGTNTNKQWSKGDRVCGWVIGGNKLRKDEGSFAEYCVATADLCVRVPDGMTDEEASSPPAGIVTAGMGIFKAHGLDLPGEGEGGKGEPILIYGGTSATATIAIQLAKLAGYEVITTCSAHSFDRVKSLGASAAFDYKEADCGAKIREYTKDKLTKVFDCVTKDNAPQICADAMSSKGGVISATLPYPEDFKREGVEVQTIWTLGMWGVDYGFGEQVMKGNPDDYTFSKKLYEIVEKLFRDGKLEVHPPKVSDTGLEGVLGGIDEVKSGKAGGVKLVYKL